MYKLEAVNHCIEMFKLKLLYIHSRLKELSKSIDLMFKNRNETVNETVLEFCFIFVGKFLLVIFFLFYLQIKRTTYTYTFLFINPFEC